MPSLKSIKEILTKRLFTQKDILPIKIILDIYNDYYDKFNDILGEIYIVKVLPILIMFYSILKKKEIKAIYDDTNNLFKHKYTIITLFKQKDKYVNYFNEKKQEISRLKSGIKLNQFRR